jgi:hypothetical protein
MSKNSDADSTNLNLVQETGKLLFHQIRQKGSKDIFADYIILLRTTPIKNLSRADVEEHKKKLEETCRNVLYRLEQAGLQAEVRRGSDKLIFIFVLCDLHRLKREVETSRYILKINSLPFFILANLSLYQ